MYLEMYVKSQPRIMIIIRKLTKTENIMKSRKPQKNPEIANTVLKHCKANIFGAF